MKIALFLAVLALCLGSFALARSCSSDSDCDKDECCIELLPFFFRCRDRSDDVGESCGGQFSCSACQNGLRCVGRQGSLWNYFKLGTGTCQRP